MGLALEMQTSDEWHVLKGDTQYGPYTYSEMIRMMQDKLVFSFDYVWSPHLDSWMSLGETAEFSTDRLNMLADKNPNTDTFNKRVHERILCKLPVFVNDNMRMWNGVVENLSDGGALIFMENPVLLPGHMVNIHFRKVEDGMAFNCTAEILTKRLTKARIQHNTGIYYAVKFVQRSPAGEKQIQNWIKETNKK